MRLAVVCVSLIAVSISLHLGYVESFRRDESSESVNSAIIMPLATWFLTMVPIFASLASYNVVFGKVTEFSDFSRFLRTLPETLFKPHNSHLRLTSFTELNSAVSRSSQKFGLLFKMKILFVK